MTIKGLAEPAPGRLRLGLIGDNIARSRSPALHRLAGRMAGLDVTYDRLVPPATGMGFEAVFAACRTEGLRGVNVTYPYKQAVMGLIAEADPFVRALGSVNTVLFDREGPRGFNTDYSGFIGAYREAFGDAAPGVTAIVGAGGVGRAIAFALATLGADRLRLVDSDAAKATDLAGAIAAGFGSRVAVEIAEDAASAASGVAGIVNATPLGMDGKPGSAIPAAALAGAKWAFDAVYTPERTEFSASCEAAGVAFLSGYALFFQQGIEAFRLFCGVAVADPAALRAALRAGAD